MVMLVVMVVMVRFVLEVRAEVEGVIESVLFGVSCGQKIMENAGLCWLMVVGKQLGIQKRIKKFLENLGIAKRGGQLCLLLMDKFMDKALLTKDHENVPPKHKLLI